jgi:hypothetical protein
VTSQVAEVGQPTLRQAALGASVAEEVAALIQPALPAALGEEEEEEETSTSLEEVVALVGEAGVATANLPQPSVASALATAAMTFLVLLETAAAVARHGRRCVRHAGSQPDHRR